MYRRTGFLLILAGAIFGVLLASAFVTWPSAPAPTPTRAAVPTFTPTPLGGADYATAATAAQVALAQALDEVGRLVQAAQVGDSTWAAEVAAAMQAVDAAYARLLRLEPPTAWQPYHQQVAAGAADCSAAMRVLALALDERSEAAVPVVGALLLRCETELAAARRTLAAGAGAEHATN